MTVIRVRYPGSHSPVLLGILKELCGITEIDTEALYRVMLNQPGEDDEYALVYPIDWTEEEDNPLPKVRVRCAKTGRVYVVPGILLEKLSGLEALGEQAE